MKFFKKMRGGGNRPTRANLTEVFWSSLGALLGIGSVAFLNFYFFEPRDGLLLVGSFGASAVIIYGVIQSPLAQPRSLLVGHFISAIVGVATYQIFPQNQWLAAALAVSLALGAMQLTGTLHPPGGATALIAIIGGEKIHSLGYVYAFAPVLLGAVIMLCVALVVNNLSSQRRYPEYWY